MALRELREKRKQEYLDSLPSDKEFKTMSKNDKMKYVSIRDFDNIVNRAKKRRSFVGKLLLGISACAAVGAGVFGVMGLSDTYRYGRAKATVKGIEAEIHQAQQDMKRYEEAPLSLILQSDNYQWAAQQHADAQAIKQLAQNEIERIEARRPVNKERLHFCVALAGALGGLGLAAKLMPVSKNRAAYKAFVMKRARGCRAREHSLL